MSKLYTEEQVRQIFKEAQHLQDCNEPLYHMFEDLLVDNNITPIKLPNDEEIKENADKYTIDNNTYYSFVNGAKWIKEQILKSK